MLMDLRSSNPFWIFHTPLLHTYHALQQNLTTDVVVIGGGISGALAAYELVKAGIEVTVISASHIGQVSTAASTSFLQYEIDTPLHELIRQVGKETAIRSYWLCHNSIDRLGQIHREIGLQNEFQFRKSLLLASKKKEIPELKEEYVARKNIGLQVDWLDAEALAKNFNLKGDAAIYSSQAGQINSYLFTQHLIHWCVQHGAQVFDKTSITQIKNHTRAISLVTDKRLEVKARYAVNATGYEAVKWINKGVVNLKSTYATISEPVKSLWKDECLIWETGIPYMYYRCTPDHRIIIGGKDEAFYDPQKRDALIGSKSKQLIKAFNQRFPEIPFEPEYTWAGTFAETPDGLPYIGRIEKWPRMFFALGYGGNGITFSQIAAEIIRDTITGVRNPDIKHFGFNRMK